MAEREFAHPQLGEEIRSISGYYAPQEEQVMPYRGREVLMLMGHACIDSSCCGNASWTYIQVPGFLVKKRAARGGGQPDVSVVDTIEDKDARDELFRQLTEKYPGVRVEMW